MTHADTRAFRTWLVIFTVVVALALSGLLVRQWMSHREMERQLHDLREAVCGVVEIPLAGPTPPPGPAGDRSRAAIPQYRALERAACDHE